MQYDRLQIRKTTGDLAKICVKQALSELRLILARGVNFRNRDNEIARNAYAKMAIREFEGINARQQWANWRTIPKNLKGRIPNRSLLAVDLCCGTGHSTQVLAHLLPKGSQILGLEYNPNFVENARKKIYLSGDGSLSDVKFHVQSVLDSFCFENGSPLLNESVDLVNSCGAVGSHFDVRMTQILAKEVKRVTKKGGIATIDSGLPGTNRKQLTRIFESEGFELLQTSRSCFLDLFPQICFQKWS